MSPWWFICTVRQIKFWQVQETKGDLKGNQILLDLITICWYILCPYEVSESSTTVLADLGSHLNNSQKETMFCTERLSRQPYTFFKQTEGMSGKLYKTQINRAILGGCRWMLASVGPSMFWVDYLWPGIRSVELLFVPDKRFADWSASCRWDYVAGDVTWQPRLLT